MKPNIVRVGIPSPLYRLFDYRLPAVDVARARPGARVRVPFGRRSVVGVVVDVVAQTTVAPQRLKTITELLDAEPLIPKPLFELACWAATYYHAPLGEVLTQLLPRNLRAGKPMMDLRETVWTLTAAGREATPAPRAIRQQALLARAYDSPQGLAESDLGAQPAGWRSVLAAMVDKGWLTTHQRVPRDGAVLAQSTPPQLTPAQDEAVRAIQNAQHRYGVFLLDGITGSGKTEVFLRVAKQSLKEHKQVLVLVPEIALSPQLMMRFESRLGVAVMAYHSGLSQGARARVWHRARLGQARVVVGTRSAIFLPLAVPGLIVCDEEHDNSYKQQEGLRYHARDVAIMRARRADIPIILGSATPSLESLRNVALERYQRLVLSERANAAPPPPIKTIDMRHQPVHGGLSVTLMDAVHRHLDAGGQVLLFLNRRGFAPMLRCGACHQVEQCHRCDAHMTLHHARRRLICHHCGSERVIPNQCSHCASTDLFALGRGTERLEQTLVAEFPDSAPVRIDRDTTRRKGAMEALLTRVRQGQHRLLVGTQMLAKGHDFPNLTLVGVINADQGLYGVDFRALERMAQLIIQVGGRAGRAEKPGEVLLQTRSPDHPVFKRLAAHDYHALAKTLLQERQDAVLPPYARMALVRAEAHDGEAARAFLSAAAALIESRAGDSELELWGPASAPMLRRQGRYRYQLLLQAPTRAHIQHALANSVPDLETLKAARRVRWSIDVDPMDLF